MTFVRCASEASVTSVAQPATFVSAASAAGSANAVARWIFCQCSLQASAVTSVSRSIGSLDVVLWRENGGGGSIPTSLQSHLSNMIATMAESVPELQHHGDRANGVRDPRRPRCSRGHLAAVGTARDLGGRRGLGVGRLAFWFLAKSLPGGAASSVLSGACELSLPRSTCAGGAVFGGLRTGGGACFSRV